MLVMEILLGILGGSFVLLVWALFGILTFGGREVDDVACKKKGGGKKG